MKKLLSAVLSVTLIMSFMPSAAFASVAGTLQNSSEKQIVAQEKEATTSDDAKAQAKVEKSEATPDAKETVSEKNSDATNAQDSKGETTAKDEGKDTGTTGKTDESSEQKEGKETSKVTKANEASFTNSSANSSANKASLSVAAAEIAEVGGVKYETLLDACNAACELGSGQTVKLLADYTVETDAFTTYLLPENSTFDLGQHTLTVPYLAAAFEGSGITIQNGRIDSDANYAIWIGNGENETSATVKNVSSNSGANVFAASATFENCNLDASAKKYYSVWADEGAEITVKSGKYVGGENGGIGTAGTDGSIEIDGGRFTFDKLVPSDANGNVTIYAGEFSNSFDAKYLATSINLVKIGDTWTAMGADEKTENADGSTTETTSVVEEDGSSTVTETTTKTDEAAGTVSVKEVATSRDADGNVTQTVKTSKEVTKTTTATTTEQTVNVTDANGTTTTDTTKLVEYAESNMAVTTKVGGGVATTEVTIAEAGGNFPSVTEIDATAAKADAASVKRVEIVLLPETIQALGNALGGIDALSIATNVATLDASNDALKTLTDEATDSSLTLVLERTDETVDSSQSITATFELTALVGDKPVFTETDANNGTITVSVPYVASSSDKTPEVYYVPDAGEKVKMATTFENGVLSWATTHFSTYEVVEKATNNNTDEDNAGGATDNTTKNDAKTTQVSNKTTNTSSARSTSIPATGDENDFSGLFAALILSAGMMVCGRKLWLP